MNLPTPFRTNAEAAAAADRYLMPNYAPGPAAFARGQGSRLWDVEGKDYIDFAAGVAVASLGHGHPGLAAAIAEQAKLVMHTSNLWLIPNQIELGRRLVALSGLDRAFFCNSGTEAIEASLKLARYWGTRHGGRSGFIATERSFHGRTFGALSVTGQKHYQKGFEPLLPGVSFVPYGEAGAIRRAITEKTCAVVVEPIQGEGGVNPPPAGYLSELREICDEADVLLILDEVQTGIGRTGSWFAFESEGIRPDIVALAKGLGGGFPIGAVLAGDRANAFEPGSHGSTFGGNHLACAAALATLDTMEKEHVLENVRRQGPRLSAALGKLQGAGMAANGRGRGLLLAADLPQGDAKPFARTLVPAGLLVSAIGDSTLRFSPPLTITNQEVDEGVLRLRTALESRRAATARTA